MSEPFRWAILGTGAVARKFVLDLRQLGGQTVAQVVASRDPDNARSFAKTLGLPDVAPDYAAAVQARVDAVYIATPPSLHEAHALLAFAAGRPVLIEKPIAEDAAAARRIAEAAQAAGVFCMEAMWTRFQPLLGAVRAEIEAGTLGEIRGFEGRFMAANVPAATSLFDPAQGGGALMHRGVYPLSLARFLLGPVAQIQSFATTGQHGVDEDSVVLLRHETGPLTSLRSSLRAAGPNGCTVYGTQATLYLDGPVWRPTGARIRQTNPIKPGGTGARRFEALRESGLGLRLSVALGWTRAALGRGETRLKTPFSGNGYHYQAQAVMQAVAAGQTEDPRMPLAQSIEIMEIIDQIRQDKGKKP
ncbi:MAG: putative dehydrogenase [Yoonia sp.]|jgi:predicted dehydrogenase